MTRYIILHTCCDERGSVAFSIREKITRNIRGNGFRSKIFESTDIRTQTTDIERCRY